MYRRCTSQRAWMRWFRNRIQPTLQFCDRRDQSRVLQQKAKARIMATGRFEPHVLVRRVGEPGFHGGSGQGFEIYLIERPKRKLHRFLLLATAEDRGDEPDDEQYWEGDYPYDDWEGYRNY